VRRAATALLIMLAVACGGRGASPDAPLHAAASLADVLGVLARRFEDSHKAHVVASYGASSTLARQIVEGAPSGVFLSASPEWVDDLARRGLLEPGSRADLLSNSLVVVVPRGATRRPAALADLREECYARIALADPEHVPAGKYAKQALERVGIFEDVRPRIVAAQEVRTALAYAAQGEVDAAIVYATDAAASPDVDVAVRVPAELHAKITYPIALVRGAPPAARELLAFLRSDEAWTEFARAGFTRP
jgi:molybdate transport system substrate-binding protein